MLHAADEAHLLHPRELRGPVVLILLDGESRCYSSTRYLVVINSALLLSNWRVLILGEVTLRVPFSFYTHISHLKHTISPSPEPRSSQTPSFHMRYGSSKPMGWQQPRWGFRFMGSNWAGLSDAHCRPRERAWRCMALPR